MERAIALIKHALEGIRSVGVATALQAAMYPFRRSYYEAKFASGDNRPSVLRGLRGLLSAGRPLGEAPLDPHDFVSLGNVISRRREGQAITLHCQNAWLQIAILAPDLLRVRMSRSASFAPQRSYAVAKPEHEWQSTPWTLEDTADTIDLTTDRVTCRIAKRPCRLNFLDADGQPIHSDTSGLAWRSSKVARFARLEPHERIYGLGEKASSLNRRGHSYTTWNSDPQHYGPMDDPLYLNIPFYTGLQNGRGYGILYDNSYRSRFDVGDTLPGEVIYLADDGEMCYYFFYGPALTTVLERYTELTGRMHLPPLWALGYQQSRWSYYPESRVREIAHLLREHHIPCDVLHLDIHYMDGYRCFTWDHQRFPAPSTLLSDLHDQGFRVIALIDCGIKADRHYHVCADGLAKGMFCAYPDGTPAKGPVWPGDSYFPDFTSPQARQWWGQLHTALIDQGVDGIWNDMNEPTVISTKGDTLAGCVRHDWEDHGATHRQAHNVYGMQMARATAEGLLRLRPDSRPFVITRSGWAGVQRYAVSWTGDNQSTWEHLRLTMPMVLGLGLSGLAFTGPDVGGFQGSADAELLVRWTQMGAFLPFFRNHTVLASADQEPWAYGEPYLTMNRKAIELRYRLLPYLYTATWQCAQTGHPIVRPLVLAYQEDERTHSLEDQFLCGDALLVAPIYKPHATARTVYLPAGQWYDFWTDELRAGPITLEVHAPLDLIPVFVRAGTVLPMWPVIQHTGERRMDTLILHVYAGNGDSALYEDDGASMAYQQGEYRITRFECQRSAAGALTISRCTHGAYHPAYDRLEWIIHGLPEAPKHILADGQPVLRVSFDESSRTARFESANVQSIELT